MSHFPVLEACYFNSGSSEYKKPVIAFESVLLGELLEGMIQVRVETYFLEFPLIGTFESNQKKGVFRLLFLCLVYSLFPSLSEC